MQTNIKARELQTTQKLPRVVLKPFALTNITLPFLYHAAAPASRLFSFAQLLRDDKPLLPPPTTTKARSEANGLPSCKRALLSPAVPSLRPSPNHGAGGVVEGRGSPAHLLPSRGRGPRPRSGLPSRLGLPVTAGLSPRGRPWCDATPDDAQAPTGRDATRHTPPAPPPLQPPCRHGGALPPTRCDQRCPRPIDGGGGGRKAGVSVDVWGAPEAAGGGVALAAGAACRAAGPRGGGG